MDCCLFYLKRKKKKPQPLHCSIACAQSAGLAVQEQGREEAVGVTVSEHL